MEEVLVPWCIHLEQKHVKVLRKLAVDERGINWHLQKITNQAGLGLEANRDERKATMLPVTKQQFFLWFQK